MKITKVELLNHGADGLKITGTVIQYSEDSGVTLVKPTVQTNVTYVPLTVNLYLSKIKIPFLVLGRYFTVESAEIMNEQQYVIAPNDFMGKENKRLRSIIDNCFIDSIELGENGEEFRIAGSVRTIGLEYIKMRTSWITPNDDWELYDSCIDDITALFKEVNNTNNTFKQTSIDISSIRELYPDKFAQLAMQTEGDDPDDSEIQRFYEESLASKGFLIIDPADSGTKTALVSIEEDSDLF